MDRQADAGKNKILEDYERKTLDIRKTSLGAQRLHGGMNSATAICRHKRPGTHGAKRWMRAKGRSGGLACYYE